MIQEKRQRGSLTRQMKALEAILYNDKMSNDVKAGLLKIQQRIIDVHLDGVINRYREETK